MTFTPKVVPSGLFSRCFRPGFGGRDSTNQRGQTEGSDGFRAAKHQNGPLEISTYEHDTSGHIRMLDHINRMTIFICWIFIYQPDNLEVNSL